MRYAAHLMFLSLVAPGCDVAPESTLSAGQESCLQSQCHAKVEQIHLGGPPLMCVDCHLGDPYDLTKEGAHVTVETSFNPSTPGHDYLEDPSLYDLDQLPLEVIQFLNPADYRVAATSCGSSALGGAECHPAIVESSLMLTRATLAGQFAGGGFIAGTQDKDARYGVVATEDLHLPELLADGVYASLDALPGEPPESIADPIAAAYFPVYEQLCVECHLYQDGRHTPGLYYSSGCNACHMVTTDESRAETADITQDIEELGHVRTHRFTNLVPDSQCAHCHVSHLGRSMLAQGIRERSEPEGDEAIHGPNRGAEDPEEAVYWGEENYVRYQGRSEIYGKPYPFFIEDEDGTNDIDETPPDVHTAAGMGCIDCHNIREAHGDSQLAGRMDLEIDVRCQTCHGRPGETATLRSDAGLAFNRAVTSPGDLGDNEPIFSVEDDGAVFQHVRFTNALHPVTQITERVDPASSDYNPNTRAGCQLHAGSAESKRALKEEINALAAVDPEAVAEQYPGLAAGHTFELAEEEADGRLECFTCHNTWTVNCYGCHMVRDDRETYTSRITGEEKPGKITSYGLSVVADALSLGFNARGRISPMVGTSIFFSHIDEDGQAVIDAQALTDGSGVAGQGNVHNPVHHHTIRQQPRDCDGCHPTADGGESEALLTAVGLGSGRFTFEDGDGGIHVLDRTLEADYDGDGTPEDPSVAGLPRQVTEVWPLVSTTHQATTEDGPAPGPLDLEAVNLTLGTVVVPQRPDEEGAGGADTGAETKQEEK